MSGPRHALRLRRPVPLLPIVAIAIVGFAGAVAATSGAFATLTSSAAATATLTEGGSLGLNWSGTRGSRLALSVGPLLPGQSEQRVADLTSTGSAALARLQLATVGTGTGTSSDGIQLALDRCSIEWVLAGSDYSCGGTMASVSPDRPVQGVIDLAGSPAMTSGATDHLRLTFRLSDSAPGSAQGLAAIVKLTATGSTSN